MTQSRSDSAQLRPVQRRSRRWRVTLSILFLPFLLNACSYFLFGEEELAPQRITTLGSPDEETYPSLSSVPDEPLLPSPRVRRQELVEGLAADRGNARYTEEALTPRTTAVPPAEPPAMAAPPAIAELMDPGTAALTAPPPPDLGPSVTDADPFPPPPNLAESRAGGTITALPAGTAQSPRTQQVVLLQQQAFQQQAIQEQRLRQQAIAQQAFEAEARQRALDNQRQREQIIQQQRALLQTQTLSMQARQQLTGPALAPQVAALPPAPAAANPIAPPALPQQAPPVGYSPFPTSPGQLIALIYFPHASTSLDDNDRQVLAEILALQQRVGQRPMRIVGHASARTTNASPEEFQKVNYQISLKRANSVAAELVHLGLTQDRVRVDARGSTQPIYQEFMPNGEAGNRRVEIYLE